VATHFIPHTLAESVEGALQVRACTRPPCHEQGAVRRPAAAHAVEGVWFGIYQCMACACAGVCLVAPALLCVSCAWHWSECALVSEGEPVGGMEWRKGSEDGCGCWAHANAHTHTCAHTQAHPHTHPHARACAQALGPARGADFTEVAAALDGVQAGGGVRPLGEDVLAGPTTLWAGEGSWLWPLPDRLA